MYEGKIGSVYKLPYCNGPFRFHAIIEMLNSDDGIYKVGVFKGLRYNYGGTLSHKQIDSEMKFSQRISKWR